MSRQEIILTAFSPAGCAPHTPVQVQKLLFLIDRQIPMLVGGPHFSFQAYHYGPFDSTVYDEIRVLEDTGHVEISHQNPWRTYRLTPEGLARAEPLLKALPPEARRFIETASRFVRNLSFSELVSAIYKAFPEMRERSVFQE